MPFNPVAAFQAGRQNALAIQGQEQGIAAEAAAAPRRNALADLQLSQAQIGAERSNTQFDQDEQIRQLTLLSQGATALGNIHQDQWQSAIPKIEGFLNKQGVDTSQLDLKNVTPQSLQQFVTEAESVLGGNAQEPVSDLDQARADKLRAETGKIQSETGAQQEPTVSPIAPLIQGLSPELGTKAQAVFDASGGGDKGVKAALKVIDTGTEEEKLSSAPLKLQSSYPNATPEEMTQLENVMRSAKTAESGFKEVAKLRDKQRQVKKGKVFQQRAVDLLDRILGADELNDVIGSIEGSDESLIPFGGQKLRGDNESEIIADIEEAGNILTADNLDIMSGVLSETDIKIIANLAGGALNRKRGEAAFIRDVTNLRAKMAGELGLEEQADLQSKTDAELLSF